MIIIGEKELQLAKLGTPIRSDPIPARLAHRPQLRQQIILPARLPRMPTESFCLLRGRRR